MSAEVAAHSSGTASSSLAQPLARLPIHRLARLLPWLLLLVLLDNKLGNDLVLAAIQLKVLSTGGQPLPPNALSSTSAGAAAAAAAAFVPVTSRNHRSAEGEPFPVHAYTCVYDKDWRLVLLERPSPLYLAGTIRQIAAPVERLTLITNYADGGGGAEETEAELVFHQLCKTLVDEGRVLRCRTARVADVVDAALAYYDLTVESFGGAVRFRKSACPLVATYLEATRGDGDGDGSSSPKAVSSSFASPAAPFPPSLVVFWEGDVSLVHPSTWLATAAAFSGAHPSMNVSSCPCFRHGNRKECTSELDMASDPENYVHPTLGPVPLPEDWMPFRRPRFSQQLFALPSTSLAAIDWKAAGSMPDGACGRFPDEGGFEHRACRWLARWGWVNVMQPEAEYVHTALDPGMIRELEGLLGKEGWPWDPPAPP